MKSDDRREPLFDAAESQTPSMCGNSMRENRETQATPSSDGGGGRSGKAKRRTSDVHVAGESDGPIVPAKRANNADRPNAGRPAAESAEERGSTKGNAKQTAAHRTQGRGSVSNGLQRVRAAARRDKKARLTALLHHVTAELLRASFYELKRSASPGIDGVTWKEYEAELESRIPDLHERVHRGTYRAKPSKRAWIPKADGRQRPLGIASLEDKIVQQAIRTILEQIYEEDFVGFSYGFRPGRGCHNALDALYVGITRRKVNWVLDADIRGFFDAIDHAWMMKFIEHRIADRRAPDPQVAQGRGVRRRRMVEDGSRNTPGGGDFADPGQRVSALRVRSLGQTVARAVRNRRRDCGPVRGRFRRGVPTSQ
jgi:RNA-directed DNA polymerase